MLFSIKQRVWAAAALLTLASAASEAAPIYYETQSLGGSSWQYNYTLANQELGEGIYEFTIFFDVGLYDDLSLAIAPEGWDPLAIQPDLNLPDDGFYDALALSSALMPGGLLSGFAVRFDFLGEGTPGSQRFDIVDPISFNTLLSGQTVLLPPPVNVPEPSTLALLGLGLIALVYYRRRTPPQSFN